MAGLLDLPFELLTWIFKSVYRSDLRALCLTHSGPRPAAEKLLYKEISISWVFEVKAVSHPITALLRSLQVRPELAGHVQIIRLMGKSLRLKISMAFQTWRSHHDATQYTPRLLDWESLPDGEAWKRAVSRGLPEALVACLLFTVRKTLRELYLDNDYVMERPWDSAENDYEMESPSFIARVFEKALYGSSQEARSEPGFPLLRSVQVDHHFYLLEGYSRGRRRRDNFHHVLPYLYLPSVEHLALAITNTARCSSDNSDCSSNSRCWSFLEDNASESPPTPTNLKSHKLSMIREGRLGQVLKLAKVSKLKRLEWNWYYEQVLRDGDDDRYMTNAINMNQIAADLSRVRESLEYLTISASTTVESVVGVSHGRPRVPELTIIREASNSGGAAFSQLLALKRLQVPLAFLVGFSAAPLPINTASTYWTSIRKLQSLPEKLEHLTLTDDLSYQPGWEWDMRDVEGLFLLWLMGIKPGEEKEEESPDLYHDHTANWKPYTPSLKSVHLSFVSDHIRNFGPDSRCGTYDWHYELMSLGMFRAKGGVVYRPYSS